MFSPDWLLLGKFFYPATACLTSMTAVKVSWPPLPSLRRNPLTGPGFAKTQKGTYFTWLVCLKRCKLHDNIDIAISILQS